MKEQQERRSGPHPRWQLLQPAFVLLGACLLAPSAGAEETVPPPAPAEAVDVVAPPAELEFHDSVVQRADGTVSYFYRTNFVTPADLKVVLEASGFAALLSAGTSKTKAATPLREIPRQNVLVLDGDPDAVNLVLSAIAYFDVAAPQVFIEAKVVEVSYDSNFEVGIEYLWSRADQGPNTLFRGIGSVLNPPSALISEFPPKYPFQGTSLGWGLVGKNAERFGALDLTLQALQMSGKAEVLSRPSIIATQNIQAEVMTTEHRPVVALASATSGGATFNNFPAKSGVSLTVKPTHIGERYVTIEIAPQVDGLAGLATNTPGGQFTPITTMRRAKTTVTLGDGETLVIGGLYTSGTTVEKARTPLLSDLPLLGELFTRTRETKSKTELIFILTPHIVRKTQDLRIVLPPAELERLEKASTKETEECDCPPRPPQLPPPPGWGAQFLDE